MQWLDSVSDASKLGRLSKLTEIPSCPHAETREHREFAFRINVARGSPCRARNGQFT